jgi:hypothetical protein
MSNVNDLLEPLRYKSLGDYSLADIRSIGGGVFTEAKTLEHLVLLDRIAKAYQSVHIPTLGNIPISGTSEQLTVSLGSTKTSVNLVTAADNVVLEIVALAVRTPSDYETTGAWLSVNTPDNDTPAVIDMTYFDTATTSNSGVFYGNIVNVGTGAYVTPSQLLLNGGESLLLNTAATPNDDVIINVLVRKYSQ